MHPKQKVSQEIKSSMLAELDGYLNDTCERSDESNICCVRALQRMAQRMHAAGTLEYDQWFDVDAYCDMVADSISDRTSPPGEETNFSDR